MDGLGPKRPTSCLRLRCKPLELHKLVEHQCTGQRPCTESIKSSHQSHHRRIGIQLDENQVLQSTIVPPHPPIPTA